MAWAVKWNTAVPVFFAGREVVLHSDAVHPAKTGIQESTVMI